MYFCAYKSINIVTRYTHIHTAYTNMDTHVHSWYVFLIRASSYDNCARWTNFRFAVSDEVLGEGQGVAQNSIFPSSSPSFPPSILPGFLFWCGR